MTRYTSRCSSVIRRDQAPAIPYLRGSGFPIPLVGSRSASSISRLMRLRIERSARGLVGVVLPALRGEDKPHALERVLGSIAALGRISGVQ